MATSISASSYSSGNQSGASSAKNLCRIVGLACIVGFIVDLLVITFPPAFGQLTWRLGLMQQVSDRSIILLFGLALFLYSTLELRALRRKIALVCLVLGLVFQLSCVLVIRDAVTFQNMAVNSINTQLEQAQKRLQEVKPNDPNLKVTQEQLQTIAKQLSDGAQNAQNQAKTTSVKTGVATVGNLVVVGLALLGLGRYGLRSSRG